MIHYELPNENNEYIGIKQSDLAEANARYNALLEENARLLKENETLRQALRNIHVLSRNP